MLGYRLRRAQCPTARRNKSGYRETKTDTKKVYSLLKYRCGWKKKVFSNKRKGRSKVKVGREKKKRKKGKREGPSTSMKDKKRYAKKSSP